MAVKKKTGNELTLCEVKVFASTDPTSVSQVNLAQGQLTSQKSTSFTRVSSRAVDGNTNGDFLAGSCTHTTGISQPWWIVDLGVTKPIAKVVLFNRIDSYCKKQ